MNCDKYIRKAKVGVLLFLSVFIIIIFREKININTMMEIFGVFYIFGMGFFGIYYILPYIKCIVDYNQSHKPPY